MSPGPTNHTTAREGVTLSRVTFQPRRGFAVKLRFTPVHVAVNWPPDVDIDRVHGPVAVGIGGREGRDVCGRGAADDGAAGLEVDDDDVVVAAVAAELDVDDGCGRVELEVGDGAGPALVSSGVVGTTFWAGTSGVSPEAVAVSVVTSRPAELMATHDTLATVSTPTAHAAAPIVIPRVLMSSHLPVSGVPVSGVPVSGVPVSGVPAFGVSGPSVAAASAGGGSPPPSPVA